MGTATLETANMPKKVQSKFFPGKLRIMLDEVDGLGLSHGSSWVSDGRAFAIHDPDIFMKDIAPQFFDKQTHLRSFHRQLSIWGFTRLETGAGGRGVWFNKNFIRDKPDLIKYIKRVPVKNPKPDLALPKNHLPDYTNYQLPVSFRRDSVQSRSKGSQSMANPVPVHQPHGNFASASAPTTATGKTALPTSKFVLPTNLVPPTDSLDYYFSALSRMPPGVNPRQFYPNNHNATLPAPPPPIAFDQSRGRYPPFKRADYQPSTSAFAAVNPLPVHSDNLKIQSSSNSCDKVAQHLVAHRNNAPFQNSIVDRNNNGNSNAALLGRILDSRRVGNQNSNNDGARLNSQDLISADTLRNFLFQTPKSS